MRKLTELTENKREKADTDPREDNEMTNSPTKKLFKWGAGLMLVTAVFVLPLMFFTGCSNTPTDPQIDSVSFWDQPFTQADQASAFTGSVTSGTSLQTGGGVNVASVTAKDVTAATGDTIAFAVAGRAGRFVVPAFAIPNDTNITVEPTTVTDRDGTKVLLEFGPDGLHFSTSATLSIDTRSIGWDGRSKIILWWLNPATSGWEVQQVGVVSSDGLSVSFSVDHFSMYGIGKKM